MERLHKVLKEGKVITYDRIKDSHGHHLVYKALLKLNCDEIKVIIKPRENIKDTNDSINEAKAYIIGSKILGMDYIPPVVFRKIKLNKPKQKSRDVYASVMMFINNFDTFLDSSNKEWRQDLGLLADFKMLRVVIQDYDGNKSNYAYGNHWITNEIVPIAFDFGASKFSSNNLLCSNITRNGEAD